MSSQNIVYCKARVSDAAEIKLLIDNARILSRSIDDILHEIRSFFVAKDSGRIVGVIAVDIIDSDYAELRSLAVNQGFRGKGIGTRLVELALYEAKLLDARHAVGFTKSPDFFRKFKFRVAKDNELPESLKKSCISGCTGIVINLDEIDYVIKY